ncbi:hypothetical protein CALCODRAFT_508442 [Calocera cornea HHB12733]|uniref:Uncharacterized protein n=1 Tax=Calocera cornea HHB12733 TaxID=1353952 RepID=A0A165GFY0_9BASI|nr:hypothetical protein CALCODRAFT_508442 [Calocera cornea HHB12733]
MASFLLDRFDQLHSSESPGGDSVNGITGPGLGPLTVEDLPHSSQALAGGGWASTGWGVTAAAGFPDMFDEPTDASRIGQQDYVTLANSLAFKRKFSALQTDELLDFVNDADPTTCQMKLFANTILMRDMLQTVVGSIMQKWVVPANTQEDVFNNTPQTRELTQLIVKRMGERRSWMLRKLKATLSGTLADAQKELTIPAYAFEFDTPHWTRLAFIRATLRVHIKDGGTTVQNDDGTSERIPKEFWQYLDDCLKAAKSRHGGDRGRWASFLRNVLQCDLQDHPVGGLCPKSVNEPMGIRSAAQVKTERME